MGASSRPRRLNRICPRCQSSERYRALELLLRRRGQVSPGFRLLEVAPVGTVEATARALGFDYTSVDISSPRAGVHADLCHLPFADASFDVIVCFHVLEHIVEDRTAAQELARVVGADGEAIVVVPREEDRPDTFEEPDTAPGDRERLYGQSDHVRIYGADVAARWSDAGVGVDVYPWTEMFDTATHREAALDGDDDCFWILRTPEQAQRQAGDMSSS